jgi:hypothetical protein
VGFRSFEADDDYAFAQLLRVATNFISSDGLSVGLGLYDNNNNYEYIDNGVYVIGKDWRIIDRLFFEYGEQQEYNLKDMVIAINDSQPESIRLSSDEIENYFINNPLKELI